VSRGLDVASSTMATVLRLGAGLRARPVARQPEKLLELYEFEACPFCRRVREALSEFDLDAMVYPCPRGGTRFRPKVVAMGGREMFPYLVDPNGEGGPHAMYESADIVRYLRETYGGPSAPTWLGAVAVLSAGMAAAVRAGHGRAASPSRPAEKPLELWSFEGSPYCRLVRETLSELELPYVLHNVAKGSPRRDAFVARSGKMQVPYLVDPNEESPAALGIFESTDIVRYLEETYGARAAID
jgi:glutathione S-transferase